MSGKRNRRIKRREAKATLIAERDVALEQVARLEAVSEAAWAADEFLQSDATEKALRSYDSEFDAQAFYNIAGPLHRALAALASVSIPNPPTDQVTLTPSEHRRLIRAVNEPELAERLIAELDARDQDAASIPNPPTATDACPECGSTTYRGCGAKWHDTAPNPEGTTPDE